MPNERPLRLHCFIARDADYFAEMERLKQAVVMRTDGFQRDLSVDNVCEYACRMNLVTKDEIQVSELHDSRYLIMLPEGLAPDTFINATPQEAWDEGRKSLWVFLGSVAPEKPSSLAAWTVAVGVDDLSVVPPELVLHVGGMVYTIQVHIIAHHRAPIYTVDDILKHPKTYYRPQSPPPSSSSSDNNHDDTELIPMDTRVLRSIVEVSSRHINGSIKSCQVRGLLHDLAVHEAGHGNFVTVFSQALDATKPNKEIRRASLQFPHQDQQRNPRLLDYVGPDSHFSDSYVGQNTRSLIFFGFGRCFLLFGFVLRLPECSNFRLLKVLELVGVTNYADDLVRGLDELIQLKYLGFRNCLIEIPSCSFRRMRSLETLDVRGTLFDSLNNAGLWEIDTLRHVLCDDYPTAELTLNGPLSTAYLSNLQSMRWVSPSKAWDIEVPHLNNLHMLGLSNPFDDWSTVTNLVSTLPSLVSLGIKGVSLPMEIVYPYALPNYQYLQSLYLEGNWSESVTLKASLFPPYLEKLTLIQSQLKQNPMPELGKLQKLRKLSLREHVRNYSGPTICPEGFAFLQYLEVGDSSIKNLMVEKEVMPKLTHLKVHDDIEFKLSPELQQAIVVIR